MAAFKDKNDPFCRVLSQSLQEFWSIKNHKKEANEVF
jgi:hypothetical protein